MDKKPKCKLSGTDGNVFVLAAKVSEALEKAGQPELVKEFQAKLFKCHSYEEALSLMADYVEIK